jgi:hypothetical protein
VLERGLDELDGALMLVAGLESGLAFEEGYE